MLLILTIFHKGITAGMVRPLSVRGLLRRTPMGDGCRMSAPLYVPQAGNSRPEAPAEEACMVISGARILRNYQTERVVVEFERPPDLPAH